MSTELSEDALRRVSLTYMPYGGFPQERHFDHLTPTDLSFVLASLHGRKRRDIKGRAEVIQALDEARRNELEWHADQLHLAIVEGLGWWTRLLPSAAIVRIVDKQLEHYYDTTAKWAAEQADLHALVAELHGRVDRLAYRLKDVASRKPVEGPRLMCGRPGCANSVPLDDPLLPPGWLWGEKSGTRVPFCPDDVQTIPTQKAA
ncbi:hypothetical protein [Streptomyces sp. cg35]|uniref:hypothetical protein n=1 Tax=Streptomyces sp. cg35 TaxID=3421650 RepID=UPI003D17B5C2